METHTIEDCEAIKETEKALLVHIGDGAEIWVPKSVIHDDSDVYSYHDLDGSAGALIVAYWFADKEGLI